MLKTHNCRISDKSFLINLLKKHVEKVHEIEQSHKRAKAQAAIRGNLKKLDQTTTTHWYLQKDPSV